MFTCCLCDKRTQTDYWIVHYVGKVKEEICVCRECAKADEEERKVRITSYYQLPYKRLERMIVDN